MADIYENIQLHFSKIFGLETCLTTWRRFTLSQDGSVLSLNYISLLDCRLALSASSSTIFHTFLMLQAPLIMSLLLIVLEAVDFLEELRLSAVYVLYLLEAGCHNGSAIYTRMLQASKHVRVSIMAESPFHSFHLSGPGCA